MLGTGGHIAPAYLCGAESSSDQNAYTKGTSIADIWPIDIGWESGAIEAPLSTANGTPQYNSTAAHSGSYGLFLETNEGVEAQSGIGTNYELRLTAYIKLHNLASSDSNKSIDIIDVGTRPSIWLRQLIANSGNWDLRLQGQNIPDEGMPMSPAFDLEQDRWYKIGIGFRGYTDSEGWIELLIDDILKWRETSQDWETGYYTQLSIYHGSGTTGILYVDDLYAEDYATLTPGEVATDTKSNLGAFMDANARTVHAFMAGVTTDQVDSNPAYLLGAPEVEATPAPAYLTGINIKTGSKHSYLKGYNTSTTTKVSYMYGGIAVTSSQHAYCPGYIRSMTHSKHAFMDCSIRSRISAYIGEPIMVAQAYITLAESTGTTVCNFRVIHEGYTDGELEKAGSVEPTIGGGVDVSMGAVRRKWEPIIKVYGTNSTVDEAGFGTRTALEYFFGLNNPGGTPTNLITMTDHHGVGRDVFLIDTLQANLLTTLVEGSGAVFHVKVRMIEAN
jgi:hypothetical protein